MTVVGGLKGGTSECESGKGPIDDADARSAHREPFNGVAAHGKGTSCRSQPIAGKLPLTERPANTVPGRELSGLWLPGDFVNHHAVVNDVAEVAISPIGVAT